MYQFSNFQRAEIVGPEASPSGTELFFAKLRAQKEEQSGEPVPSPPPQFVPPPQQPHQFVPPPSQMVNPPAQFVPPPPPFQFQGIGDAKIWSKTGVAESPLEETLLSKLTQHYPHQYAAQIGALGVLIPQLRVGQYRADFAIINGDVGIFVEVDGHEFHSTPEQKERDAKRDRELLLAGWVTVRFTGREIYRNPSGCVDEILALVRKLSE